MMFSCVPLTGGCEWQELKGFVSQYNSMFGTNYVRISCLDVESQEKKAARIATGCTRPACNGY